MNKQTLFQGRCQISQRLSNSFLAILKNILKVEQWTNRNQDIKQWTKRNKVEDSKEIKKISFTTKCYFSNMFSPTPRGRLQWSHLIRGWFENSETRRGFYLLLELFNFVKIFQFYLMTQSLDRRRERFSFHLGYLLHVRRPHSLFSFLPSFQSRTAKEDVQY